MIKVPRVTALLLAISTVLASLLGYGAFILFSTLDQNTAIQQQLNSSGTDHSVHMGAMDHGAMIIDDQDFLNLMIPHHQEAVDTSALLLTMAPDQEFKIFLEGVVIAQTKEIAQMNLWHKHWFMTPWVDTGQYMPMMPSLEALSPQKAREAYLRGMIEHHEGAISMAKAIQPITQRKELLDIASAIIKTQREEIEQMQKLLNK